MAYSSSEQFNDYQRRRYRERLNWAIEYLGDRCATCGGDGPFDFDHLDPALKTANVTAMHMRSFEVFKAEVDKCQLLCRPCHIARTAAARPPRRHGTRASYKYGRCRCDSCRSAARAYARKLKDRAEVQQESS
jgi:hypothetical protein